jgi:hypothetical protein
MKNKAMEFAERHVEKALLAVGVIFIGWIAYHNFVGSPNSVHLDNGTGPLVPPSEVGSKISQGVDRLWRQVKQAEKVSFHHIHRENYVARLQLSQENPLPNALLAMSTARFAPFNTTIEATGMQQIRGLVFRAPQVPALPLPKAEQARGVAEISSNKTKDVVWVKLTSIFPTKKWIASMASRVGLKPNEEPLPAAYRQTIFYRVQVRRQSLQPNGAWGPWKRVKGTYLRALPAVHMSSLGANGRAEARTAISSAQMEITDPAFYTIEQIHQRIVTPPPTQTPRHPIFHPQGGQGGIPGAPPGFVPPNMPFTGGGGGGGGGFGAANIQRAIRQQQRMLREQQMQARVAQQQALAAQQAAARQQGVGYGPPIPYPGFNGMPQPNGQSAETALAANADVPLKFYDTSVTPGKTYRYEMRVKLVNPVYKVGFHLTDPAVVNRPWLTSDWSDPSKRVRVSANLYFYLISSQIFNHQVDFRIFKWVHGVWAVTSEYVSPGEPIGNTQSIPMVDPQTGNLKPTNVDFNTHYELVDEAATSNGSINVVVLSPDGQLEIRNSEIDATDPQQRKLIKATMETGAPSSANPNAANPNATGAPAGQAN